MDRRLTLQSILETQGAKQVYFQPPENIRLEYPCIIYSRARSTDRHADNNRYHSQMRYLITVIDRNPDSQIVSTIQNLPFCSLTNHFVKDGLNHDVFTLYF